MKTFIFLLSVMITIVSCNQSGKNKKPATADTLTEKKKDTVVVLPRILPDDSDVGVKKGAVFIYKNRGFELFSGGGGQFSISGLETGGGLVSTTAPVALGTRGLFIEFPSNFTAVSGTSWTVQIPNTQASVYAANYNAYQAAIQMRESALVSAQAVVNARQADLALKQADARPAEIAAAEADILSARGKLEAAQVAYDNTLLRAPASGTITAVDVKLGEQVTAQKPVITLEDVSNIYIEANINESDIPRVVVGQKVNVTFDAFGPEKVYDATVSSIDPSSTTVSGVVNYKVKATLADSTGVLPGMTANGLS